jgi:hypothetical protein
VEAHLTPGLWVTMLNTQHKKRYIFLKRRGSGQIHSNAETTKDRGEIGIVTRGQDSAKFAEMMQRLRINYMIMTDLH